MAMAVGIERFNCISAHIEGITRLLALKHRRK